jgi:hypothetical protein
MNWISDSANHETVANAVALALKAYNDERDVPQAAWNELRYDFGIDVEVCPFENFSKTDFFKLCELLKPRINQSQTQKLLQRILGIQDEYNRTLTLIASDRSSKVDISQCEYWRRIEFSMQEVESIKKLLPSSEAPGLWAKLPTALSEQEEVGFQYYLEKAKKIADQVGAVTKTVAAAARSKAMDLTGENSAASFSTSSLASPNARDFLLSIDSRMGAWEVAGAGFFSGRTSLKTRMIHAVCDAFYRSRTRQDALQQEVHDGFLEISDQAVKLQEGARASRVTNAATYEAQEMRVLQFYAEKIISPLTKPGHALQIYQSLLAIDGAAKVAKLSKTTVAESQAENRVQVPVTKSVPLVVDSQPQEQSAALSRAPQRPPNENGLFSHANDDDDDNYGPDDNRSKVNFSRY